jgi:PAS domain S-box-containing protein
MSVLLWSVFRFEPRETATAVLALSGIGIWATIHGSGPFSGEKIMENEALLLLQLFVATVSISKMTVAALVNEWRQSKKDLTQKERLFQALIEKSADAVSLIDTNANILYASPSTKEVLKYTPQEFVGLPGLSIVHSDDLDRIMKLLSDVVSRPNETITATFRVKRKDGIWIWVEATTTNLLHDPTVHALVVNYRDVTERIKIEEAKNEFMMIAAHQLRTPLSTMRWTMELLLKVSEKLPVPVKEKIKTLFENNQKMIELTNSFLDSTRIVQGKIIYQAKPTDISPIIQKQIDSQKLFAKKENVRLEYKKRTSPFPLVSIDPMRFDEVIQNILSNAIKYTKKRGLIKVSTSMDALAIHVIVADNGIGIPVSQQDKLFTKFYRATNAKIVLPEGSGLGLFTAQSYAERWGGKITVTSPTHPEGYGTTVDISIPSSLVYKSISKGGAA